MSDMPTFDITFDDDAYVVDARQGIVGTKRHRKKLAIVGFASSSRMLAPFDDDDWEIWAMNQLYRFIPRATRWFEIHNRPMFEADIVRDTDYVGWLQKCPIPIYAADVFNDIPASVRYPIEDVTRKFGVTFVGDVHPRPYFTSSPAYMVALGIALGFEEIGIWGIDLVVGREYDYEKACMEYFLGIATGRGIKVTLPVQTALLKAAYRYGIDPTPPPGPFSKEMFESRMNQLQQRKQQLLTEVYAIDGAVQEHQHWHNVADLAAKNATVLPSTAGA